MDTALGLGASAPAAGAGVLAGCHGLRAGHASNAGEACVVQRIVGEFVQVDVGPDIVFRPERERIHLYELIRLIPSHHIGSGAEVRLVAADAGDPCPAACQELPEWLYFADEAASVGVALPEPVAMLRGLIFERRRADTDEAYVETLGQDRKSVV